MLIKRLSLLIVFGSLLFAETSVSVMDILKLADKNSIQIKIAQNKLEVAAAQTEQAWSMIWPQLSLSAGVNRMDSYSARLAASSYSLFGSVLANVPSINLAPLTAMSGASTVADYYSAKVSLSQILWNGSAITAVGASNYGLNAASAQYNAAKEDTYLGVLTLAFSIIQMQKNLEVMNESKKQLQGLYNKVIELQKNGLATKIDVLRTKASLAGLNVSIIGLQNGLLGMFNNLEMLVNAPLPSRVLDGQIVENLYKTFPVPDKMPASAVLEKRYDYLQLVNTSKLMDAAVDIQRWAGLPSVMLLGSYGYQSTTGFNFNDTNRDWMVGVNASWSFLNFGSIDGKVNEADSNAQQMRHQIEQLQRAVANDLDSLQLSLKATYDKIDAIGDEVAANADAFELMNSRYTLGEVTNLELIDAQTQYLTAKKKLVEAKIEYAGLALRWMKSTSTLLSFIKKEAGL